MLSRWWSLCLAAIRLGVLAQDETEVYPQTRFTPWQALPGLELWEAVGNLGYNQELWNVPGTNNIEFLSYSTIAGRSSAEAAVIQEIIPVGTEDTWDCYIKCVRKDLAVVF